MHARLCRSCIIASGYPGMGDMFWPDGRAYHGSYDSWLAEGGSRQSSPHCQRPRRRDARFGQRATF